MSVAKMRELWWKGPEWHRDSDSSPSDIKIEATAETEQEARIIKNVMTSTTLKSDVMDEILQRYSCWKFSRIKIMDTEIPTQLQKVEIGKTNRAFDDQGIREL